MTIFLCGCCFRSLPPSLPDKTNQTKSGARFVAFSSALRSAKGTLPPPPSNIFQLSIRKTRGGEISWPRGKQNVSSRSLVLRIVFDPSMSPWNIHTKYIKHLTVPGRPTQETFAVMMKTRPIGTFSLGIITLPKGTWNGEISCHVSVLASRYYFPLLDGLAFLFLHFLFFLGVFPRLFSYGIAYGLVIRETFNLQFFSHTHTHTRDSPVPIVKLSPVYLRTNRLEEKKNRTRPGMVRIVD